MKVKKLDMAKRSGCSHSLGHFGIYLLFSCCRINLRIEAFKLWKLLWCVVCRADQYGQIVICPRGISLGVDPSVYLPEQFLRRQG